MEAGSRGDRIFSPPANRSPANRSHPT